MEIPGASVGESLPIVRRSSGNLGSHFLFLRLILDRTRDNHVQHDSVTEKLRNGETLTALATMGQSNL